jgi:indole-3-glycerol phosphate synthase
MPATLREIVEHTRVVVEETRSRVPESELRARIADADAPRGFFEALTAPTNGTRVIAEVKRRSPSAGLIRPEYDSDGFDPSSIAHQYSEAGASAISCLTDEKFFGGDLRFLRMIKATIALPVLRKDFMIDPYQILEARAHDADAILLIAECLTDDQIRSMLDCANEQSLSVLLEVHSRENLLRALPILAEGRHPRTLLGINNRDLNRMVTDLAHTTDLLDLVPDRSTLVSESGIRTRDDLQHLNAHGVHIALIGEHLMRQAHPGHALAQMIGPQ